MTEEQKERKREYNRKRYAENRDTINARIKARRDADKEAANARARARYAENPEKFLAQNRAWRDANREKHDAYRAAYRRKASTKARMRPYLKEWEARHKSWRLEYNRKYYIAHRDEMIASAMEYKRRKRDGK